MREEARSIEAILAEAVEMPDTTVRCAFVTRACGADTQLRRAVEQLIDNHFRAGRFLEAPALWHDGADPCDAPTDAPEAPGTMIGPYKLREVIGEGGMGVVYVAEQETPVRRRVALKIIKPGMDTREVIARFEAERQALALMNHPHIAQVLDAGATENGRPYFVMELVRGIPITEFCDQSEATTPARLALFVAVCQAIQHAHLKGIIHRDIKPSNVLVTVRDGLPVPKVIDFGVAKAVDQRLTGQTVYTHHAQMIGTPLYMSPEQAEISAVDVDTRSDVYSLGVLLYELLTGWTPFDREQIRTADWDDIRRILREVEPPRPSTRVTTHGAACTVACPRCCGEPRKLVQTLRGELDWIVMKALDKDRARRYQTARGLAADVQRYLDGEPVEAGPASMTYRLRKCAQRHKAAMTTAALVAGALVIGTAISVWQTIAANTARRVADERLADEITARQELVQRDAQLRLELYATDLTLAWRYWLDGDARRSAELLERWQPAADEADLRGFEWHQLWVLVRHPSQTLVGHDAPILAADVSPDGRLIASGDRAGTVKIWDLPTGRELQTLRYGSEEVCSIRFAPDGLTLASAGQDRTVHLWAVNTWQEVARLEGHEHTICCVAWSRDGRQLASASRDHTVRIWDRAERHEARVLTDHTDVVRCLAWSPDGTLLATAGADRLVRLWNAETWELVAALEGHDKGLLALAFSPDGRWLASAGYSSRLIVYDCSRRREWARLSEQGNVWSLAFAEDSRLLVVGSDEGRLGLWQLPDREGELLPLRTAVPLRGVSRSVVFVPHAQLLLTASEEDHVISLNPVPMLTGRGSRHLQGRCLNVDLDRDLAVTTDAGGAITLCGLRRGDVRTTITIPGGTVLAAALSPRADMLASSGMEASAYLHDTATGTLLHHLQGSQFPIHNLAFAPDGTSVAGGDTDGTVSVWRTETGELVRTLRVPTNAGPVQPAFSSDGRLLAAGSLGTLAVWEVASGHLVSVLASARPGTYGPAFSPEGAWLAAGGDGHVSLWNMSTQQDFTLLTGNHRKVMSVAFAPDGRTLATLAEDQTIRLWNVPTRRELFTLVRSDRPLTWLRFTSPHALLVGTAPDACSTSEILVFDALQRNDPE